MCNILAKSCSSLTNFHAPLNSEHKLSRIFVCCFYIVNEANFVKFICFLGAEKRTSERKLLDATYKG